MLLVFSKLAYCIVFIWDVKRFYATTHLKNLIYLETFISQLLHINLQLQVIPNCEI